MFEDRLELFKKCVMDKGLKIDESLLNIIFFTMEMQSPKSFLFEGPPGSGKTAMTEAIYEYLKKLYGDAEYIFYQCTYETDETDLIYKILPDESGVFKTYKGPLIEAIESSNYRPTVLVLDEFDKTRMSADAYLLDFIQNCRVRYYKDNRMVTLTGDPTNLYIILTSNKFRDLSEPLLRRLVRIEFTLPSVKMVREILYEQGFDDKTVNFLTYIYEKTVDLGLRKPATIQELIQLGRVLPYAKTNEDVIKLIKSYIIKTKEDEQLFFSSKFVNKDEYSEDYEDDYIEYMKLISNASGNTKIDNSKIIKQLDSEDLQRYNIIFEIRNISNLIDKLDELYNLGIDYELFIYGRSNVIAINLNNTQIDKFKELLEEIRDDIGRCIYMNVNIYGKGKNILDFIKCIAARDTSFTLTYVDTKNNEIRFSSSSAVECIKSGYIPDTVSEFVDVFVKYDKNDYSYTITLFVINSFYKYSDVIDCIKKL